MILKSYEIQNWGPHKYQKIVFDPKSKTIAICAENDQGKSWIVRGIGFTLSIGRNEYGDQTSIHAGESEAQHTLIIQHQEQTHTIQKIVKGKTSEDEGTKTFINGVEVDRAKFEEFYTETLGLPHPSIWLPLTIAMQNETDFHLRSKKSEREEALRAACQLTRIDNWKDALQTKTNEEEKKLLANHSEVKGRMESLLHELNKLEQENKSLEEKLNENATPMLHESHSVPLVKILENIAKLQKSQENLQKLELETIALDKGKQLQENALQRTLEDLAKLPGFSPEEEEETESQRECLLQNLHNLQKTHLHNALKVTTKKLVEKKKLKTKNPKDLQELLTKHEAKLTSAKTIGQTLQNVESRIKENQQRAKVPLTDIPLLQSEIEEKEKEFNKILHERTCLQINKAELESHLGKLGSLKEAEEKIQVAFQSLPPIQPKERAQLTLKLIHHWNNNLSECPVCLSHIKNSPLYVEKTRLSLIPKLEETLHIESTDNSTTLPIHTLHHLAQKWEEHEDTLNKLTNGTQTEIYLKTLKEKTKQILEAILLAKDNQTLLAEKASLTLSLQSTLQSETLSDLENNTRSLREQIQKDSLLEIEIKHLEQELEHIESSLETLPNWEVEKHPTLQLSKTEIEESLKITTEKLQERRKTRHLKIQKEKEALSIQNKLQALLESLQNQHTLQEFEKNYQKELITPKPAQNPALSEDEAQKHWQKIEKEQEKIKHLLEEVPKKQEDLQKTIANLEDQLKNQKTLLIKTEAARRLIRFLDYKNAPRKLLQSIVERLFHATNQLAQALEVDLQLHAGKNLEFLTKQKRGGTWIEQKTERLGFGKGAILGICFRLACQKMLLPDTGFLILDEPTANVDLKRKIALKTFLQNLSEETESKTKQIILIEHDLDVIELCQSKVHIGENRT